MKPSYTKITTHTGPDTHFTGYTPRDGFHAFIVVLHTISSILATVIVFRCDAAKGNQQATIPFALPLPPGIPEYAAYRGAYPHGEDGEYIGNTWNPYALILGFEWITVAFAICNLKPVLPNAQNYSWIWLGIGAVLLVVWNFANMRHMCFAMNVVLFGSYLMAAGVCVYFNDVHGKRLKKPVTHESLPSAKEEELANNETFLMRTSVNGREWYAPSYVRTPLMPTRLMRGVVCKRRQIPKGVKGLKMGLDENTRAPDVSTADDPLEIMVVAFKYAEYCVTAPLLFLAVVCLLTVDAPAWIFLSGYFMIMACNLLGIALHYSITAKVKSDSDKGWVLWFNDIIMTGNW